MSLVPLAPQESLVLEAFQDLTDVEALSPVNVSALFFICDKIVASLYLLLREIQLQSSDKLHSH